MLSFLISKSLAEITINVVDSTLVIDGSDLVQIDEFKTAFAKVDSSKNYNELKVNGNIYSIESKAFDLVSGADATTKERYSKLFSIVTVNLGNIETVTDNLFHHNFKSITQVIFGNNIRYIGENFQGCTELSIDIPATVERIHPSLLHWIKSFKLQPGNKYYSVCDDKDTQYLLYKNQSLIYGIANTKSPIDLKVPDCITELDTLNQYKQNIQIKSIDFNNVKIIGQNTFDGCTFEPNSLTLSAKIERIDGHLPNNTDVEIGDNKNFELVQMGELQILKNIKENKLVHVNPSSIDSSKEYTLEITKDYVLAPYLFQTLNEIKFASLKIDSSVIPESCFGEKVTIMSLVIGESVQIIERKAFKKSNILGGQGIPKTIKEIREYAFEEAIKGQGWCDVSINFALVSLNTFSGCSGIKTITICAPNVTIGENGFSNCANLISVSNDNGGFIKNLHSYAFDQCLSIETFQLTDEIDFVNSVAIPKLKAIYDSNGMLIAGTKLISCLPDFTPENKEINLDKIKLIYGYALKNFKGSDVTLNFENVERIENYAFSNSIFKKLVFGTKLTTFDSSDSLTVDTLIFKSERVDFGSKYYSFGNLKVKKIQLPKKLIYTDLNFNLMIDPLIEQTVYINENLLKFEKSASSDVIDTLVLSGENYTENYLSFPADFKLVIKSTVRNIGSFAFSRGSFKSVTIEEGLETLNSVFTSESIVYLPSSIKFASFWGGDKSKLNIDKTQLQWSQNFLVSKDKKVLCGFADGAKISDIPEEVEVLGQCSLNSFKVEGKFTLPKNIIRAENYSFPSETNVSLNDKIEYIGYHKPLNFIDYVPASLKEISYSLVEFITAKTIEDGTKAFFKEKNVWYWEGEFSTYGKMKFAIMLANKDIDKLELDCDYVLPRVEDDIKELGNKITEIKISERSSYSFLFTLDLVGLEKLEKYDIPKAMPQSYYNTALKGNFSFTNNYIYNPDRKTYVYNRISIHSMKMVPTGVLHLYFNGDVEYFVPQMHSPWIHVPRNLGFTPENFSGCPIIYDMEDYVEPPPPEEPSSEEPSSEEPSSEEPSSEEPSNEEPSNEGEVTDLNNQDGNEITGGAIAGIVIGVIAAVALIGFAVFWFVFRKKKESVESDSASSTSDNQV